MSTETVVILIVAIASLAAIAEVLRGVFRHAARLDSPHSSHSGSPQSGDFESDRPTVRSEPRAA
jgi:hypothetical protein